MKDILTKYGLLTRKQKIEITIISIFACFIYLIIISAIVSCFYEHTLTSSFLVLIGNLVVATVVHIIYILHIKT